MEGILETLDSWRSLTHHSPVEGSQVSDYPGGGVLGKGRGRRKGRRKGRRQEDGRREEERMMGGEEGRRGEEEGEGGRRRREEERKGGMNRICKEVMDRRYHGESSV